MATPDPGATWLVAPSAVVAIGHQTWSVVPGNRTKRGPKRRVRIPLGPQICSCVNPFSASRATTPAAPHGFLELEGLVSGEGVPAFPATARPHDLDVVVALAGPSLIPGGWNRSAGQRPRVASLGAPRRTSPIAPAIHRDARRRRASPGVSEKSPRNLRTNRGAVSPPERVRAD